jgi:acyl-CoA synthetase (AMP-forming)/AMP-acid ligase II
MTVRQIAGSFATTVDLMAAVVDAYPDRIAFVDGERRLSFAHWDQAADEVAAVLAGFGVGKGDVVCLHLPASADYAICYGAAMRLGAITSGINPRLGAVEVASIFSRTKPRAVIYDTLPAADPPPGAALLSRSDLGRAAAGSGGRGRLPAVRLDLGDPVAIVWTSGTTGEPKGAVFDHANLKAVAAGTGVLSEPGDVRLSPLPFAHVGYMTRMWDELANVITTVIAPTPWKAGPALRLIEDERITVGQGVPTQWALMLDHPAFEQTDLSSLRIVGTGATRVPPELVRRLRDVLGCPVIVRYASTESGGISTGSLPTDPDDVVANTVGRPSAGVEVSLIGDDGGLTAPGSVGTVRLRSGAIMRGYWHDPEKTAAVLSADGWLTTDDLGSLDPDGNLRLVGRRSDVYIRGGYNVYPSEVEAALGAHPAVRQVAVFGIPDPVLGQIGMAAIVSDSPALSLEDLRRWCKERLADYKAPDRLLVLPELPLTAMAKVDKRALARLASFELEEASP